MKNNIRCPNMNHGRSNVTVRHCPKCGEVVNKAVSVTCSTVGHASQRKGGSQFCVDCGRSLLTAPVKRFI